MKQGDLVQLLKEREVANSASAAAASSSTAEPTAATPVTGKLTTSTGYTLLTDIEFWNIFRQVTAGVRYLHLQNIVHGDIKPQVTEIYFNCNVLESL